MQFFPCSFLSDSYPTPLPKPESLCSPEHIIAGERGFIINGRGFDCRKTRDLVTVSVSTFSIGFRVNPCNDSKLSWSGRCLLP